MNSLATAREKTVYGSESNPALLSYPEKASYQYLTKYRFLIRDSRGIDVLIALQFKSRKLTN